MFTSVSTQHNLVTTLLSSTCSSLERKKCFDELLSFPITADLLTTCVHVMRKHMIPVRLEGNPIDTCGTGGSGKKTINTSTLVAFIVAAAGGKVAKHGNRSASGNCGSFDLLEHLGVRTGLTTAEEIEIFNELGVVFLFAPSHHPALRHLAPFRKQHGKKTVFNLAGPLCNPAGVKKQIIGTGDETDAYLIATTLLKLGNTGSMVVRGTNGLDEITTTTSSTIYTVTKNGCKRTSCSPADLDLPYATEHDISGEDPVGNARIFLNVLQGKGNSAQQNIVVANAAYGLMLAGVIDSPQNGVHVAREILRSGKAFELFRRYKIVLTRY